MITQKQIEKIVGEYDKDQIFKYITTDKKATENKLNIIVVDEVGKAYIKATSLDDFYREL